MKIRIIAILSQFKEKKKKNLLNLKAFTIFFFPKILVPVILESIRCGIAQNYVFSYFNILIFHNVLLRKPFLLGAWSKSENYCLRDSMFPTKLLICKLFRRPWCMSEIEGLTEICLAHAIFCHREGWWKARALTWPNEESLALCIWPVAAVLTFYGS